VKILDWEEDTTMWKYKTKWVERRLSKAKKNGKLFEKGGAGRSFEKIVKIQRGKEFGIAHYKVTKPKDDSVFPKNAKKKRRSQQRRQENLV